MNCPAPRRWLTIPQAAELLSLHPKTVSALCLRKVLPSVKIGRSRRIDGGELERQLERQIAEGRK